MEIRNNPSAWTSIESPAPAAGNPAAAAQKESPAISNTPAADHATVSAAGADISQPAQDGDVRWEKVAALQQALAAGTYNVSATDVASKLVDSMLGAKS